MILLKNDSDDQSAEPLAMRYLSDAQKEQLGLLLEQYLTGMESGLPPTIESLVVELPELLEPLRACVDGLENLHRMTSVEQSPKVALDHEQSSRRLGDFDLHEEIGRGGMGVVYRATQLSLRRTVAIKLLPLTAVLDSLQLTRFQHEAEAAASLLHPNIVPVFAVGCERGVHFYAMQFIDGESLGQTLDRRRDSIENVSSLPETDALVATGPNHMPWRRAVAYAIQVAEGLHAAHEFGVIHRDIKPSNLILDHNGKLWITDFGLARIQNDVSLTQSGDVVGTMRYMSPEQAHGQSAIVDGRTDVYSLGATLYEMLCLRPAHEGDDAPAILRLIDNDSITPLRRYRSDLPLDLETVVTKAMARQRDGRYETAMDFAEDLRRVLAGEPTAARPPTMIDRASRWANKHRNAVAVSVLVGVIGLIGVSIFTAMLAAEKRISDANAIRAINFGYQASRNEQTAREAIDRLGTQMAESLSDIPAANAVRRRLLGETLDYYRRIASETSADGTIGKDLAITYWKIGEFESELGSSKEAIEALKRSEQLFATLAERSPQD